MYINPQPYKCPRCTHTIKFGPHEGWTQTPITEQGNPICPHCWEMFLQSLGAEMRCTVDWDGTGSAFDKAYKKDQKK